MKPSATFDCAVIGDWHLAFVTAVGLAQLGRRVVLVTKSDRGEFPQIPIEEPGLRDAVAEVRTQGRLEHRRRSDHDWSSPILWVAIDVPINDQDVPDPTVVESALRAMPTALAAAECVVVSSQVPLGYCQKLQSVVPAPVAYVPENLQLGTALRDFAKPSWIVIGATTPAVHQKVRRLLEGVATEYLHCDPATAEMAKHATNFFLASSISFANEFAFIGARYGVDHDFVARVLRKDVRIGPRAYVQPGLGFAGGTLPRDLRSLQAIGREIGATPLVDAVLAVNDRTLKCVVQDLAAYCGRLQGARVLLLGYSYKEGADTLRRSPAVELARLLAAQGAVVSGYDPVFDALPRTDFGAAFAHRTEWAKSGEAVEAVVLITPRTAFRTLPWRSLVQATKKPPLLLDTRGFLDESSVVDAGLSYQKLWSSVRMPVGER